DSLLALHDAVAEGSVGLDPADPAGASADPAGASAGSCADLVGTVRDRAYRTMGAWAHAGEAGGDDAIWIGDRLLTSGLVAVTGAVELAVHGWDITQACGQAGPIPPALAGELLELCRLLVTDADRPARFAAPVEVGPQASPSGRLVA